MALFTHSGTFKGKCNDKDNGLIFDTRKRQNVAVTIRNKGKCPVKVSYNSSFQVIKPGESRLIITENIANILLTCIKEKKCPKCFVSWTISTRLPKDK